MQLAKYLLLALPATLAMPHLGLRQESPFSNWTPAGEGDARSPCPCLNALANHDILPHSGQGITLEIIQGALNTVSVGSDLAAVLFKGAEKLGLTVNGVLNLDALNKHNAIEHDGSLSRGDAYFGDNHSFNQTIWTSYLANYGDSDIATHQLAGKARLARLQDSRTRNPTFTYGSTQQFTSNGETTAFLGVLGGPKVATPPLEFVRVLIEQERLPFNEGWRPSVDVMDVPAFNGLFARAMAASGEVIEGTERPTQDAVSKVLGAVEGVSHIPHVA